MTVELLLIIIGVIGIGLLSGLVLINILDKVHHFDEMPLFEESLNQYKLEPPLNYKPSWITIKLLSTTRKTYNKRARQQYIPRYIKK